MTVSSTATCNRHGPKKRGQPRVAHSRHGGAVIGHAWSSLLSLPLTPPSLACILENCVQAGDPRVSPCCPCKQRSTTLPFHAGGGGGHRRRRAVLGVPAERARGEFAAARGRHPLRQSALLDRAACSSQGSAHTAVADNCPPPHKTHTHTHTRTHTHAPAHAHAHTHAHTHVLTNCTAWAPSTALLRQASCVDFLAKTGRTADDVGFCSP